MNATNYKEEIAKLKAVIKSEIEEIIIGNNYIATLGNKAYFVHNQIAYRGAITIMLLTSEKNIFLYKNPNSYERINIDVLNVEEMNNLLICVKCVC